MNIHIPILRAGKAYRSLNITPLPHFRSGETVARMSIANRGLIEKDLRNMGAHKKALEKFTVRELLDICKVAAQHFRNASLEIDEGVMQTPDDYVRQLSATTGMPQAMCRNNMDKIILVMEEMAEVLGGLTRGLDLSLLDSGWNQNADSPLSFICETEALGEILPSNSPGVNSLWLPAIPLKVPLVLKPGSQEPWTPLRIARAFMAAGCPPETFSYYPTSHDGAAEILLRTGRSMLFGDKRTVAPWINDPRVQIHGPGWSKVIVAADKGDDWEKYLDVMTHSACANGGRSCINASGVWVTRHGRKVADALAQRFAKIKARAMDDPQAEIAAFTNKPLAHLLNDAIDSQLQTPGAEDITARYRKTGRLVEKDGCVFLLPTVVYCEDPTHPLAQAEYLFPFISVVEVPQEQLLTSIGSTLVGTAITEDPAFIRDLFASHNVERLNVGPVPTMKISWNQPHEGNLFEHLYRQRALQFAM